MFLPKTGDVLSLPEIYFFLLKSVWKQKKFIRKNLFPNLIPFAEANDGITGKDLKKITSYYALGVPAILGESLAILRGEPLHQTERYSLTYLGGISGLLDDLFDDPLQKADHLEEFILQPENLHPSNAHEQLLSMMYIEGLSFSAQPRKLKNQALMVYKAQQQSLQQKLSAVSKEKVVALTLSKGGTSFVFYRLCMNHPLSAEEEELLSKLGGLMQLGNDIFDVWEDHREGTVTAATQCKNIPQLRKIFHNDLMKVYELASLTPYPRKQIHRFLQIITLALSRVFVCLDQFEVLQHQTGNIFSIEDYERKQLICDMQKPANQLKAIKYYLKTSRDINFSESSKSYQF
ncbi:hypothetical protein FK178_07655 [Antarcticibacterium arcticum]|uniref:Polyprenyl synthetase n=1 Tax=Antarcticibacterium arcticum TaxID=2585771 RepID=A0A5B8YLB8_9FLAO|nr:hypothetical protein [Antarcticibacterium arcticum]QED37607.1 hypothetical protein FK178_07655 [Antarcticibacterium arcticum]